MWSNRGSHIMSRKYKLVQLLWNSVWFYLVKPTPLCGAASPPQVNTQKNAYNYQDTCTIGSIEAVFIIQFPKLEMNPTLGVINNGTVISWNAI